MIPRSAKKCQRKCKENIQVSVFLPPSPWGLISDHIGKEGEALLHYGEQLLILCQNIFKIWTVPSFLWCAAFSVGLVTGGVKAIHEAPFIFLSDMLSVMVQRGSILIVWTDHSREKGALIWGVDRIGTSLLCCFGFCLAITGTTFHSSR